MSKTIKLLDCTLRDGGRLFNCEFSDYEIAETCRRLSISNIDIVEVGFIRDPKNVTYYKNSTFFTDISQISKFIPSGTNTTFVAFVDYGMFDESLLPKCDQTTISGIRLGFTRKDFLSNKDNIVKTLNSIKNKGYKLFVQGVNTLGYTEKELESVIEMINSVKPWSFGIVDTYGAMFPEDVERLFTIVDQKMDKQIKIDFHAHNNKQLAFANSIQMVKLCSDKRELIIDGTLEGMGKCAGNLNLELMANYLADECGYNYDFDEILDTIDEFIRPIKSKYSWGYSVPALMGGLYKSHPNNIIYLFDKFRLDCKDFKNIISMIDPDLRQRYDYPNIERLYWEYSNTKIDDSHALTLLSNKFSSKKVLIKSPGHSIIDCSDLIDKYVADNNPEIITVSYVEPNSMCFTSNKRRYDKLISKQHGQFILTSNIKTNGDELIINYNSLVDRRYKLYDNSVIMLLNLLKKLRVSEIAIAGFDGYEVGAKNYVDSSFSDNRKNNEIEDTNAEISRMVKDFIRTAEPDIAVKFITPSKYMR